MPPAYLLDLPATPYAEALAMQRAAAAARRDGRLDRDLIILVEHPPVFTLGRRGGRENLLITASELRTKGIAVIPVERGGDITYHGPGQLVVYPLIDLNAAAIRVVDLVTALEAAMVQTAAHWGVTARGDTVHRGAWVGSRKLGSVGITVRRGVSFHGLALNATTDLTPFDWINPCGIQACRMTSLARETDRPVDMAKVRRRMADHLGRLLRLPLTSATLEDLAPMVREAA
ncbi:lipoyl(octanoyl) transferase LipB [Desulfatitalea alkaliphila]|uniref:Octanoyltransferase n=1 Tax=Desulfatitalea alkaliphila TaxID=2929485 RepID=A0AA41R3Z8_9BACT|nr:lipoyl(octanoyl) transferase LipB [Desulfatitalea alkaliphila]MCJ8501216.1 lipoyl(octanoyl) transferase LipB [Desulfatitalea alkaliphila]